ncbi:MAG: hypothetical protein KatS3mg118_2204 [Paracoccaceae bacterium]|nr:MAG: hypothetical protein KatS3mg118_2204 [Paracoccaceae bacterium]
MDAALDVAVDHRAGADVLRHLRDGRDLSARLAAAGLALDGSALTPQGPVQLRLEAAPRAVVFALADGQGQVELDLAGVSMRADPAQAGSGLPPLALAARTLRLGLELPLVARETPRPVALRLGAESVEADDALWALIDPGQALPRDPAQISLVLTGSGIWHIDPLTLIRTPAPPGLRPFDLPELALEELRIAALDAELTARGAARIPPGSDQPEGRLELAGRGLAALLGRLQQAGLIDRNGHLLAQGLLSAYSTAGAEPGQRTSVILFGPDGVTVNGRALQPPGPAPAAPAPAEAAPAPAPPDAAPAPPAPAGPPPAAPAPAEPEPAPPPGDATDAAPDTAPDAAPRPAGTGAARPRHRPRACARRAGAGPALSGGATRRPGADQGGRNAQPRAAG